MITYPFRGSVGKSNTPTSTKKVLFLENQILQPYWTHLTKVWMINPPGRTKLGKYLASVYFHPGNLFNYAMWSVLISPMVVVTAPVQ